MAKITIKVGQPIVYVNENGRALPGQIFADVGGGRANLIYHSTNPPAKHVTAVPHYSVSGARNGAHWKKAG